MDADERAVELLLPPLREGLRDRDPEIPEQFLVYVAKLGLKARAPTPGMLPAMFKPQRGCGATEDPPVATLFGVETHFHAVFPG